MVTSMYASTPVSWETPENYQGISGGYSGGFSEAQLRSLKARYEEDTHKLFIEPKPMAGINLPEREPTMSNRRIVQVFIADPDINVPLDSALIYKSEPKFTDASDQELYFEVPIVELLKVHNEKRGKWQDKEATKKSGREVFLEPAKIRDLKMVVVNIAQF